MPKTTGRKKVSKVAGKSGASSRRRSASTTPATNLRDVVWRLDRLERQVKTLSELVRDHAEDADRLVRIVGEDHEALRRELVLEHQESLLRRKRL